MSYTSDMEFVYNYIDCIDIDYTDVIKTKQSFNYLVNNLQADNLISQKSADNMYLSMDKDNKKAMIVCGSYRLKL